MMGKHTFHIPCTWEMYGTYIVEATDLDEAIQEAEEGGELPDGSYVECSLEVNHDCIADMNQAALECCLVDDTPTDELPLIMTKLKTEKARKYLSEKLRGEKIEFHNLTRAANKEE